MRILKLPSIAVVLLLAGAALSCNDAEPTNPSNDRDPKGPGPVTDVGRVLFMGNSLTYVNALPAVVDSLAKASGIHIESTQMASPNYALIDHYNIPGRRAQVMNGHYKYVIMQQGPSSLPENRDSLRIWSELWNPIIRDAGGIPALYAVWPDKSRFAFFHDVSESYRLAAVAVNGLFMPAGDTWLETWKTVPDAPLYGSDNFHPDLAGTYAAAVVIVSVLSNRDPTSLAASMRFPTGQTIDSTLAATIRRSAKTVLARHREEYPAQY